MIRKQVAAGIAAATVLAATASPVAAATVVDGLWDATTTGGATNLSLDCGEGGGARSIDSNGFCWIDDYGSVELGVKFTTSKPVKIGGIRVYRVDDGTMTGTLWTAGGVKLASGTFAAPQSDDHGWQDLVFDAPVDVVPGTTYVASYFAPNSDYAFEWDFFAGNALTVGPLTATASTASNPNGVFCYGGDCFPEGTYKDTNYWVTPLLWEYDFGGYRQPIDTAALNKAKAGSAIPVKFSLGADHGLDILRDGYPKATKVGCTTAEEAAADLIEETASSGFSTLKYDPATDQYTYVWKTSKSMSDCYRFELGLNDGSSHTFKVTFNK